MLRQLKNPQKIIFLLLIFILPLFYLPVLYRPALAKAGLIAFFVLAYLIINIFSKKVIWSWSLLDKMVLIWLVLKLILSKDILFVDVTYKAVETIMFVLVYFITKEICLFGWKNDIINAWLLALFVVCLMGLHEAVNSNFKIFTTFGNSNLLAAFIVVSLPVVIFLIIQKERRKKIIGIILLFLCVLNLWYASSWSASIAVVFIIFALIGIFFDKKKFYILSFLASVIFISIFYFPQVQKSFQSQIAEDVRPYIWSSSISMIHDNTLTGVGLGRWYIEYPIYRDPKIFELKKSASATKHAHNVWLEEIAESGVFVGLIWSVLPFVAWYLQRRRKKSAREELFNNIVFISILALLITNIFDVNMQFHVSKFWYWMLLGILSVDEEKQFIKLNLIKYLLIGISVFVFFVMTKHMISEFWLRKGVVFRKTESFSQAITCYEKALEYHSQIGILYKLAYAYNASGLRQQAIQTYQKIIARAPLYAEVNSNMAALLALNKNYKLAEKHYRIQLILNPLHLKSLIGSIAVYLDLDALNKAQKKLKVLSFFYPDHFLASKTIEQVKQLLAESRQATKDLE